MTLTTTDLLLEATGVSKTYGAVVALQVRVAGRPPGRGPRAHGRQRRRQEHARQDPHRRGPARTAAGSPSAAASAPSTRPAEARRGGLVSVYQEPALIPDLDIRANLRLTETPLEPFRHWLSELGLADLDLSSMARRVPLASLRIIDLARALAIEPDVLMLDEMTAALPANLTERVLEVVGRQRGGDRSVIFISHRHDRDRRRLRPGDRAARGRDRRRRGRDRGLRGADRRAHARRQSSATMPAVCESGRLPGRVEPPTTPRLTRRVA